MHRWISNERRSYSGTEERATPRLQNSDLIPFSQSGKSERDDRPQASPKAIPMLPSVPPSWAWARSPPLRFGPGNPLNYFYGGSGRAFQAKIERQSKRNPFHDLPLSFESLRSSRENRSCHSRRRLFLGGSRPHPKTPRSGSKRSRPKTS